MVAQQSCELDLDEPGLWSRPYGAFIEMAEYDATLPVAEIAHAIVLPPPAGAMPNDPAYARVLFMCRSNCVDVQGDEQNAGSGNRSFLWKPNSSPGDVLELDGPHFGYIGTSDPFCSGHTAAADGSVPVVGGLNYVAKCLDQSLCIQDPDGNGPGLPDGNPDNNLPVGHRVIHRLDTSLDPPLWTMNESWPALMGREHWYPTVSLLHDGTLFIAGHYGAPKPDCPVPYSTWPYGPEPTHGIFQRFDPSLLLPSVAPNTPFVAGCGALQPISAGKYPRLHLLSDGRLLFSNAREELTEAPLSFAMDFQNPPCAPDLRWANTAGAPAVYRDGGSSVHLLVRDELAEQRVRDLVIVLGGTSGNDDTPCPTDLAGAAIYDSVEQFDTTANTWEALTPMLRKRVNQNAVILPIGSVFVPGGTGLVGNTGPACEPVLTSEEFFPSEIFGGPSAGTWRPRAPGSRPRGYHSVAGLLPDGRVFVAGGTAHFWVGHAYAVYHTVEIFSPEYVFASGRPRVTLWPDPLGTPIDYSPDSPVEFGIDVTLFCNSANTVSRVVLIRSSSSTHSFDMSQRYVELDFTVAPGSTYPNLSLNVVGPATGFVAPPGYYLLFVIDANGLPSEGRWVRVQDV